MAWTPTRTDPTADLGRARGGLELLLGSTGRARFVRDAFGRSEHAARIDPETARGLFDWSRLNAAIAEHRLGPPRLRLERAGGDVTAGVFRHRRTRRGVLLQDLDPAALTERLREGATLIVDAANELSPPLQALCCDLSTEFTAACQANLYACWGETQGFDVHWDDHDVFVVQVEGRKRWALYGTTQAAPTRRGRAPRAESPTVDPEFRVLEPGDVLYLPRGYWHAAVGLGGPTLHLTIGLTRKTGADWLQWLADEMLADPGTRDDLPFESGDAAVAARLGALIDKLAAGDPIDLARRYRRHVEAGLSHRPQLCFPDIASDGPLDPGLRLVLAQGPAHMARSERGVVLSWRGVEFTISSALGSPVRRLVDGEAVAVADFQAAAADADPAHVDELLHELLRRGALIRQSFR